MHVPVLSFKQKVQSPEIVTFLHDLPVFLKFAPPGFKYFFQHLQSVTFPA